jgi:hypothetical protein
MCLVFFFAAEDPSCFGNPLVVGELEGKLLIWSLHERKVAWISHILWTPILATDRIQSGAISFNVPVERPVAKHSADANTRLLPTSTRQLIAARAKKVFICTRGVLADLECSILITARDLAEGRLDHQADHTSTKRCDAAHRPHVGLNQREHLDIFSHKTVSTDAMRRK